jgi:CRP/FNR family transcriptional regulator, cyclic AMP receptor protein
MQQQERLSRLKSLTILTDLSETAIARVEQVCRWHRYAAGEQIVGYRDKSTDIYFLIAGKARATVYSAEGKAVVFADVNAGTMFGEIAAIDRKGRSATIEAQEPCTIAAMTADQFEALIGREPSVAMATLRHLTGEVRRLSERVFEFSTLAVQNRIHAELLRLASETGQTKGAAALTPAPSLSDIADRISTHREAVSRELSRLQTLGLLRRESGKLVVVSMEKLAALVDDAKGE